MTAGLLAVDALLLLAALAFTWESNREGEERATRIGWVGVGGLLALAALILLAPGWRPLLAVVFGLLAAAGAAAVFRCRPAPAKSSTDFAVGPVARVDERDIVFARNRSLRPGSPEYRHYYEALHPERRQADDDRRAQGGPLGKPGAIDGGYRPNLAMLQSGFELPTLLGPHARAVPTPPPGAQGPPPPAGRDPGEATRIVKGWARHLGADLVGVCHTDPRWAYSHRGEIHYGDWENWGQGLPEPLPFAVVVATEMAEENVAAAPHTPAVVESGINYAKGAYVTTILARWFAAMGHRAVAEHNRHYELLMVPLAVDAGLGELGRHGYLIADRFGSRVRLFAVQTDMPLVPDRPVNLGAEEFCERCRKCAESCPSRSIPLGAKAVVNGLERWKLDEDRCFGYWGKVGTDCCICMAVCPFSRPDRSVHRAARRLLRRSAAARRLMPLLENWVYGRKWHPRDAPRWIRPARPSAGPR